MSAAVLREWESGLVPGKRATDLQSIREYVHEEVWVVLDMRGRSL